MPISNYNVGPFYAAILYNHGITITCTVTLQLCQQRNQFITSQIDRCPEEYQYNVSVCYQTSLLPMAPLLNITFLKAGHWAPGLPLSSGGVNNSLQNSRSTWRKHYLRSNFLSSGSTWKKFREPLWPQTCQLQDTSERWIAHLRTNSRWDHCFHAWTDMCSKSTSWKIYPADKPIDIQTQ